MRQVTANVILRTLRLSTCPSTVATMGCIAARTNASMSKRPASPNLITSQMAIVPARALSLCVGASGPYKPPLRPAASTFAPGFSLRQSPATTAVECCGLSILASVRALHSAPGSVSWQSTMAGAVSATRYSNPDVTLAAHAYKVSHRAPGQRTDSSDLW